jgi:hypothetical protein
VIAESVLVASISILGQLPSLSHLLGFFLVNLLFKDDRLVTKLSRVGLLASVTVSINLILYKLHVLILQILVQRLFVALQLKVNAVSHLILLSLRSVVTTTVVYNINTLIRTRKNIQTVIDYWLLLLLLLLLIKLILHLKLLSLLLF